MEWACFSIDNGDYVTLLAETKRKARKQHRCNECQGAILPGQAYLDERYLFEGAVSTHKTCPCCLSVREHLFCNIITYNQLWSDLEDFLYDWLHYDTNGAPWARIAKLTPTARAYVLLMIEEIWPDIEEEE